MTKLTNTYPVGPGFDSGPPSRGKHAADFGALLDRISYSGIPVPSGQAWRAKDIVLNDIVSLAQTYIQRFGKEDLPDPAILFGLTRERRSGSNFWVFQKTYEGAFSFDVAYQPVVREDTQQQQQLNRKLVFSSCAEAQAEI